MNLDGVLRQLQFDTQVHIRVHNDGVLIEDQLGEPQLGSDHEEEALCLLHVHGV